MYVDLISCTKNAINNSSNLVAIIPVIPFASSYIMWPNIDKGINCLQYVIYQ